MKNMADATINTFIGILGFRLKKLDERRITEAVQKDWAVSFITKVVILLLRKTE